jgi:hypothetical protein
VNEWEMVHEQEELQSYIQTRNITHFGQAHGTPFTVEPLNKINWSADSVEAKEVLEGAIPTSMITDDRYTLKVLRYIAERRKLPEIDTYITPTQVSDGFKKWKEETSTSPSGCHLGLRRIPAYATNHKDLEKIRNDIQQVQAGIINLPVTWGFSPNR